MEKVPDPSGSRFTTFAFKSFLMQMDCLEPGLPGATWAGRSGAHITQPNVKAQTQVLNQLLVKQIVEERKVQSLLFVTSIYVMATLVNKTHC